MSRRIDDEPDPVAVVRAWCNAAGPAMARVAFPSGFQGGRLEVVVVNPSWLRELESRRQELMERLRREKRMGQLREISFVPGAAPERQTPSAFSPPGIPNPVELPPEFLEAARAIVDEDLSRRWTRAISLLLGARRPMPADP
jgi:Dna[CI] antecedent DciA-like protein